MSRNEYKKASSLQPRVLGTQVIASTAKLTRFTNNEQKTSSSNLSPPSTMKLSITSFTNVALCALMASDASAAPSTSPKELTRRDCSIYANVVKTWTESAMTRRRVAYGVLNKGGVDLSRGGAVWTQNNAVSNCVAIDNNQQTYWSGSDNSWVVDFNEVAGPAGNSAANCLLERFRDQWNSYAC